MFAALSQPDHRKLSVHIATRTPSQSTVQERMRHRTLCEKKQPRPTPAASDIRLAIHNISNHMQSRLLLGGGARSVSASPASTKLAPIEREYDCLKSV